MVYLHSRLRSWCVLCLVCCGAFPTVSEAATSFKDATGRIVKIQSTRRIVSLNGTISETLYALGAGKLIVGRDTTSYYPAALTKLPTVGYQHRLNAEGILRLKPTLVIGDAKVKPRTTLQQLRSAGVPVVLLARAESPSTSLSMIRALGQIVGKEQQAKQLITKINKQLKQLAKAKRRISKKPKVMFLYVRGTRSRFVVGTQGPIGGMIRLVGAKNAARFKRVKPISAEGLIVSRPEVFVLFAKGVASIGGLKKLYRIPGIALTPAGKKRRFVIMDDLYLGGFGPRFGHAALDLFKGIYKTKGTFRAKLP